MACCQHRHCLHEEKMGVRKPIKKQRSPKTKKVLKKRENKKEVKLETPKRVLSNAASAWRPRRSAASSQALTFTSGAAKRPSGARKAAACEKTSQERKKERKEKRGKREKKRERRRKEKRKKKREQGEKRMRNERSRNFQRMRSDCPIPSSGQDRWI